MAVLEWPIAVAALVAAALPGVLALSGQIVGGWLTVRRETKARRRERFADALAAVVAYEEFPFVIRRRRVSMPEDERIRISTEIRAVQERLAFHAAWLHTESLNVAEKYDALIRETRHTAGDAMRRAWEMEPIEQDEQMNIADIDLSASAPFKGAYLAAVRKHLSWRRFIGS